MKDIEQIVKESGREEFYKYYCSLGYSQKVAASLALFTYGDYRFEKFSMDELYESLLRGEKYRPRSEMDGSAGWEMEGRPWRRALSVQADFEEEEAEEELGDCLPDGPEEEPSLFDKLFSVYAADSAKPTAPGPSRRHFSKAPSAKAMAAPPELKQLSASILSPSSSSAGMSGSMPDGAPAAGSPAAGMKPDILGLAGAAGFSTDEYEHIEEKEARSAAAEPTSTFRMTTNTASVGVILNQLRNGRRIDRSMVRIEEMLNYFRYESEFPEEDMFRVAYEMMDAENDRTYLYVNVQGREEVKDRQNIVILLDISGSMERNAPQTQAIIATIVSKLGNGDKLSLITYSNSDHVELDAVTINGPEDRIRVLEKFLSIKIYGYTHGSKGIERAYAVGKSNYIQGGNNQVILITDGDLNFGITDKGGLEELIELKKKDHLFLSVIGTGLYNYKDDKLEVLCKHGNGVYRTVNTLSDVRKSIDEEYASLVNIIAKDVKAQVEFNPEVVETYRLLGFENRGLAREDFTNDRVISEPFGSGGYGVAFYELKMKTGSAPVESGLKYSKIVTTGSPEPGTIRIRWKEPLEEVSHELEKVIETSETVYTDNLRLAFIVYVCAEKLRGSDKISAKEIELAKKFYKELGTGIREKNSADLYKLAGILEKSESELGIGIRNDEPFQW